MNDITYRNTFLSDLRRCPRYAYHKYVEGIEPKEISVPMTMGTAFHRGLEEYNLSPERRDEDFLAHCKAEAIKELDILKGTQEDYHSSVNLVTFHLWHYFEHWKDVNTFTDHHVELEGFATLPSGRKFYFRVDDCPLDGGDRTVVDHKLCSWQYASRLEKGIELASQLVGYAWGVQKVHGLKPIYGMYNLSVKVKDPKKICRRPVREIREEHINQWLDNTEKLLDMWERMCEDEAWPQNTDSCFIYGECSYWPICAYGDRTGYGPKREEFPEL